MPYDEDERERIRRLLGGTASPFSFATKQEEDDDVAKVKFLLDNPSLPSAAILPPTKKKTNIFATITEKARGMVPEGQPLTEKEKAPLRFAGKVAKRYALSPLEKVSKGLAGMTYFPITRTIENIMEGEKRPSEYLKDIVPVPFMGKEVWASDLLRKGGMKEGWASTLLGLGLDIGLDPLTYVTGGLGKAGRVSKLAETAAEGSKIARRAEKLRAAGKLLPYGETAEEQIRLGQRGMRWAGQAIAPEAQAKLYAGALKPAKEAFLGSRMGKALSTKGGPQETQVIRELITAERHKEPEIVDKIRKGFEARKSAVSSLSKKYGIEKESVDQVLTHLSEVKPADNMPAYLNIQTQMEEALDPIALGKLRPDPEVHKFVKDMKDTMIGVAGKEMGAGILKTPLETDLIDYLTHLITPEGRAVLKGGGEKKGFFSRLFKAEHPSLQHRSLLVPENMADVDLIERLPKMSWKEKQALLDAGIVKYPAITEVNQLAREGILFPGKKISQFFYEDPAKIAAIREIRSEKALRAARILEGARDTGLKEGWVKFWEKGTPIPEGYDIVKSPLTRDVLFPKDAADMLNATHSVLNSPQDMGMLAKAYKDTLQWWKVWTLTPFPAYHFRNVFGGNLFNQMLAGMNPIKEGWWNPKGANAIAGRVQRVNIWKNLEQPEVGRRGFFNPRGMVQGRDFKYTKAPKYAKEVINTATGMKYTLSEIDELAKQNGIFRAGQYTADIFEDAPRYFKESGKTFNPLKTHNFFTTYGMKVGSGLEDNAKLGVFVHYLRQGFNPTEAAGAAHKFIFDYFDIPPAIQKAKQAMPFITWYYKNIPLQLEYMVKKPAMMQSIYKMKTEVSSGKEPSPKVMNEYYKESYPVVLQKKGSKATWASAAKWLPITDVNMLAQDPKKGWASMLWPLAKAPIELMTNRNLYFDKPIAEEGKRKQMLGFYMNPYLAYGLEQHRVPSSLDMLNPFGIFGTETKGAFFGKGAKRGGKYEPSPAARWIRFATGARIYETDVERAKVSTIHDLKNKIGNTKKNLRYAVDEGEKSRLETRIRELEDKIRELEAYRY